MNHHHANQQPLISIVIPSFNQGQFIEQAITSVLGQNYPNIELIVIDGGSSDQTLQIVEKYQHSIRHCISEPDHGQAEAINKGFRLAQGDILAWLNSDDMYLPCTLSKIAAAIGNTTEPALVYGGALYFYEKTTYTFGELPPEFDPDQLTYFDYMIQPSTFWNRRVWETVGELNEMYCYVLDWDWFIRASKICQFTRLEGEYLAIYRLHGSHKSGTGKDARQEEILRVVETYASQEWIAAYHDVYKVITPLRTWLYRLSRLKLYWLRYGLYPRLYLKYGKHCIEDIILSLLIVPHISTEPRFNRLKPYPSF
ncbi:glycosyl transferase family 2 [Candidatus Vecturithrix granuli]|uniref:Glycosyl transferase family 2 n=1 Tax=Vecturithrix granuli TaxID=1499967 RepID=A0A0S6WAY1_VECG1|nr:glycosyl transferase family 2 [Candidatus Vecturithrix granuli]